MGNVIIETTDGAQYSVVESDFKRHYPDIKFKVISKEQPADFVVTGVPAPKKARSHARKKAAAPIAPEPTVEIGFDGTAGTE